MAMMQGIVALHGVSKSFGDVLAVDDVSLEIYQGEFFTILGPSGCGKTTTLRMIAGFELPEAGDIYLQGEPVTDVPAFQRNVNLVFQDYALFPHMNVAQNVGFGLEMKRVNELEIHKRVEEALELVRLPGMGDRRPSQLSGGQQQRVALARALINRPAVLLLDEPLGALDLKLREAMRFELKDLQRRLGTTFIYVTHDQEEALTMSDRIAVMDKGHLLQVGAPMEVYEAPADHFVADFVGETNFIACQVDATDGTLATVGIGGELEFQVACDPSAAPGMAGSVIIRPEKIDLYTEAPAGDEQVVVLPGVVLESVWIGTDTRFTVELPGGTPMVVRHQNMKLGDCRLSLRGGDEVFLCWQKIAARLLTR
jgi:spermidine/putrescine transport system ATP-binding protein